MTNNITSNSFRIIIISDTHGVMHEKIYNLIEASDYVIHAGDILDESILLNIEKMCSKLFAVNGNNDFYPTLNDTEQINTPLGEIVVTHGHKHYPDYHDSLRKTFPDALAIIYGHTHHHIIDTARRPYIINPGAAGNTRTQGGSSCAILNVNNNNLSIQLSKFNYEHHT